MLEPVVKCVDHLTIRVSPPKPLFDIFTRQLLLPEAWPVTTNPFFASGGVHLGNMNLEVLQLSRQKHPASLYGIAFELLPIEDSLTELDARGIPHTPPVPFHLLDDQGWQETAWTNVFLGGLLGESALSRLFFALSRVLPADSMEHASRPTTFHRGIGRSLLFEHLYRAGMTSAVFYNPIWREKRIRQEKNLAGLEVQRVYQVTVGTRNYDHSHRRWKALLDPLPELAPGVWQLPEGLHIRLVKSSRDGLLRMLWQVGSLNRAAQFLYKKGMLGKEKDGMLSIAKQKIGNLDIRLVQ